MSGEPVTRLAVLWSHLSGYLNACLRECSRRDVELFTSWLRTSGSAPFDETSFAWLRTKNSREWDSSEAIDGKDLLAGLEAFRPQMILVSGWNHPGYRAVAKHFAGRATRILCMDNPWEETPKQWLGRLVAPWYVKPLFDGAFVAGERQFQFARRLGFDDSQILTGLYAPDAEAFRPPSDLDPESRKGFLFVGRLSPEKGVATLAEAYRIYRATSTSPWTLAVAGTGPLRSLLEGIEGVNLLGFVQPAHLPALMHSKGCLVVPSLREPFGVQIAEGASAGMAIIATSACGASVHLVRSGFNGQVLAAGDPVALADALVKIESCPRRSAMTKASQALAGQFTPAIWSSNLLSWQTRSVPKRAGS